MEGKRDWTGIKPRKKAGEMQLVMHAILGQRLSEQLSASNGR